MNQTSEVAAQEHRDTLSDLENRHTVVISDIHCSSCRERPQQVIGHTRHSQSQHVFTLE
ncbi:hypothetical protein BDA96_06G069400 [Sorghum bicolor]|uniref:Uncharacterized protein n=2 Tax=Sorghum bicolor TaxID=4558 RepID=A0A921QR51_SORBI|nr:hypothetical protein BDA96_06G069400 [Sorghum bicolor]OQU81465.1 hypothetical protein SORBI_3006G062466 [Sorghum bicolor]